MTLSIAANDNKLTDWVYGMQHKIGQFVALHQANWLRRLRIANEEQYTHNSYICFVLYLFSQNHIDNFNVKNEIQAVSGMCKEHTGYHNENTDACP